MFRVACCLILSIASAAASGADVIRSRADLEEHLRREGATSPIQRLSPGARERFLYSLRFDDRGLVGASGVDLAAELTQPEIVAVLSLFGPAVAAQAPESHSDELRWLEKNVRAPDGIGEIERRYNQYFKASIDIDALTNLDDGQWLARHAAAFEQHLGDLYRAAALRRVDDRELRLLRRAAQDLAKASPSDPAVAAFRAVVDERKRRESLSTDDLVTLQALWLAQRRFPEARRLASDYPGMSLPRVPRIRDELEAPAGTPTVWRLDAEGKTLTRELVDLAGPLLLVTASADELPAIARLLQADPRIAPLVEQRVRWLTWPPGMASLDTVRAWNDTSPTMPLLLMVDIADWRWASTRRASLHVVRNGAAVESLDLAPVGAARTRDRLVALLERQGFL